MSTIELIENLIKKYKADYKELNTIKRDDYEEGRLIMLDEIIEDLLKVIGKES